MGGLFVKNQVRQNEEVEYLTSCRPLYSLIFSVNILQPGNGLDTGLIVVHEELQVDDFLYAATAYGHRRFSDLLLRKFQNAFRDHITDNPLKVPLQPVHVDGPLIYRHTAEYRSPLTGIQIERKLHLQLRLYGLNGAAVTGHGLLGSFRLVIKPVPERVSPAFFKFYFSLLHAPHLREQFHQTGHLIHRYLRLAPE